MFESHDKKQSSKIFLTQENVYFQLPNSAANNQTGQPLQTQITTSYHDLLEEGS